MSRILIRYGVTGNFGTETKLSAQEIEKKPPDDATVK